MSKKGIYKISSILDFSKFYIGSSVHLINRKSRHFGDLRRGVHHNPILQNYYNKYKDSLTFEVLLEVEKSEDLIKIEQSYLDEYNPHFNIRTTAESNLGWKQTKSTKKKISEARKKQVFDPEIYKIIALKNKERLAVFNPHALPVINIDTLELFKDVNTAYINNKEYYSSRVRLGQILNLKGKNPGRLMYLYKSKDSAEKEKALLKMKKFRHDFRCINTKTNVIYNNIKEACLHISVGQVNFGKMLHGLRENTTDIIFLKN